MIKVVGFCERNAALTHDEYRAGHAGYHVSLARRLKNIRGYVNGVWSDHGFDAAVPGASFGQPAEFFDIWDGYSELYFDSYDEYYSSREGEPDRAGEGGLELDNLSQIMSRDGDYLYTGAAHQFASSEHVIVPVERPERHIPKLQQWGKRRADVEQAEFERRWVEEYAPLYVGAPGLRGYVIDFREEGDVMSAFFMKYRAAMAASDEGTERRNRFYGHWDGLGHLYFETIDDLRRFREGRRDELERIERELFAGLWYREVIETIGVLPRRDAAVPEYRR